MGRKRRRKEPEKAPPTKARVTHATRPWILVGGLALLVGLGAWGAWSFLGATGAYEGKPLNVILITADTLRADRLGCYGNKRVATPNLDHLAASGVWTGIAVVGFLPFAVLSATSPLRAFPNREPTVEITPEYDRLLKRMLITIPASGRGQQSDGATPSSVPELIARAYTELFAVLPDYTIVEIVVRKEEQRALQAWIDAIEKTHSVNLHIVPSSSVEPDFWAQDLGEPFRDEERECFLISMELSPGLGYDPRVIHNRYRIAEEIVGPPAVYRAEFAFEGGNLIFDRGPSGLRALIGYSDVVLTQQNYSARGRNFSFQQVVELITKDLNGAEVVVMGREIQSEYMRHIDKSFMLLADGIAVVNEITDPGRETKERTHLEHFRSQLEKLGYRIITLDNTATEIEKGHTSTNAIPFIDARTGKKTIIYPVFPGEVKAGAGRPLVKSDLMGKGLRAYETYEAAGYRPLPVRDLTHPVGGSTHCIVNVTE